MIKKNTNNLHINTNVNANINDSDIPVKKKRGRKPKGGKIINKELSVMNDSLFKPNIILHLKCTSNELSFQGYSNITDNNSTDDNTNGSIYENNLLKSNIINNINSTNNISINDTVSYSYDEYKIECDSIHKNPDINEISSFINNSNNFTLNADDYKKIIYSINSKYFNNNTFEIKSDCFWCHHSYDSHSIHIPKHKINGKYNAYGYFCSLECATAFLFNENINTSDKFENYSLLLYIYSELLEKKNIIAAPNPYYTLAKYCGNMTIEEYRKIYTTNHKLSCINKPSSLIIDLPELHLQMINGDIANVPEQFSQEQQFKIRRSKKKSSNSLNTYFGI